MVSKYAMPGEIYEKIPAFINGSWSEISYSTKEEFILDLEENYFKEVGEYGFTEKTLAVLFNTQKDFLKNGYYCNEPYNSKGFITFWDFEKLKSRKGLFIIDGENKWYFSRDIYFWLNFLPIFNKKKKRDDFPNLTDAHVRMDLYEFIAELKGLHGIITKKRQFGSSYYHAAKLINRFWFEPSTILQMGASLDLYVNGTKGTWRYLNSYRNWLNKETAWFRPIKGGDGNWKQSIDEINPITKQSVETGRQGVLTSTTFERSATNGVGGAKSIFYHEEAGIASKMDTTYEFMRSAVEDGNESTGFFVGAGSVGDLSECEPLKAYMYAAEVNGFYAVNNKLIDSEMPEAPTGLFISEVHAMTGFVDQYGNSDVEGALKFLEEQKETWRNTLDPKSYAIRCSQKPTYLNEAFKFRGQSIMPLTILEAEEKRIIRGEVPYEIVELEYDLEDETGQKVLILPSKKEPISEFPINPKTEDKTGAIVMYQRPIRNLIPLTTYYASVDPVGQGKTLTSNSLACIYIYRNSHFVSRNVDGYMETSLEGDEIVCVWTGRYDDINDTHEQIIKIILLYQAWTLCENNVPLLIDEMKTRRLQKYLVPKKQFSFSNEFDSRIDTQFYDYGWRNTGTIFDKIILNYLLKYLVENIHEVLDEEGNVKYRIKGVSRVKDIMAIKEMLAYFKGLNVDRIVTLAALITFVELQRAHRRNAKSHVTEMDEDENLDNPNKMTKLNRSPFNNLGTSNSHGTKKSGKRFFKNFK